jgi:hypothetical protein
MVSSTTGEEAKMATKVRNKINNGTKRDEKAKIWYATKTALDAAVEAEAAAKQDFLDSCPEGEGEIVVGDIKVVIDLRNTPAYDVDKARDLLSAELYKAVTVPKIDSAAWKLFSSQIADDAIDQIVSHKTSTIVKKG